METRASLGQVISDFFNMHYDVLGMNVYGAHQVGKHIVAHSRKGLLYA